MSSPAKKATAPLLRSFDFDGERYNVTFIWGTKIGGGIGEIDVEVSQQGSTLDEGDLKDRIRNAAKNKFKHVLPG